MKQQTRNIIRSVLYGMTGAGLFRRLNYPGAPVYAIDPRPVDEILMTTGLRKLFKERVEGVDTSTQAREGNEQVKKVVRHHV